MERLLAAGGHKADRFKESELAGVYVITDENRAFGLRLSLREEPDRTEVHIDRFVEVPFERIVWSEGQQSRPFQKALIIFQPPGRDKDIIYCAYSPHAEHYSVQRFVINEDGEVWRWINKREGWGALGLAAIRALAGALGGAGLMALVYARRT